eukprot:5185547-Prymnesium_polylepis.1
MRQARRCMQAAVKGSLSRAKRLRPDDLWLPHEAHSVPETAAWDWDLTPLTWGGIARPIAVSGRNGLLPATSVVRDEVLKGAMGFEDDGIVSEMVDGVQDDSSCRRGTL